MSTERTTAAGRIEPVAPAAGTRHLAIVRSFEPQEECVTALDPHRSRGPWNAPQHAVAGRVEEFPRCARGLREGRLSLDQVGVIAARAGNGSDEHYAELAAVATVNQLRTAISLEPRPEPQPDPQPSITRGGDDQFTWWRIKLAHAEAA